MRRVVIAAADACRESLERGGQRFDAVLVTLTYKAAEGEGAWASRDVAEYVNRVCMWLRYRGVAPRYQWCIELQQSGRPHYHVLFWLPKGVRIPKPDCSGQWTKGMSNVKRATRPVGYLVKYVSKGSEESEFPKGARLFGTGAPDADVKLAAHRAGLPMWVLSKIGPCSRARKLSSCVVRLGWQDRDTLEVFPSPYEFAFGRDEWGFVVITIIERG